MNPNFSITNFVLSAISPNSSVVISIPHDSGNPEIAFSGFCGKRESGVFGSDRGVWPIASGINEGGQICSLVRGLFPRAMIDYNRSDVEPDGDHAFVDPELKQFWSAYHDSIESQLKRSDAKLPLLIDLHGFKRQPSFGSFDIILGTHHRQTVDGDIDERLASFLRRKGYEVYLPEEKPRENELFPGRYTSFRHGTGGYADAIQVEVAPKFRGRRNRERGKRLSLDLREFIQEFGGAS